MGRQTLRRIALEKGRLYVPDYPALPSMSSSCRRGWWASGWSPRACAAGPISTARRGRVQKLDVAGGRYSVLYKAHVRFQVVIN